MFHTTPWWLFWVVMFIVVSVLILVGTALIERFKEEIRRGGKK